MDENSTIIYVVSDLSSSMIDLLEQLIIETDSYKVHHHIAHPAPTPYIIEAPKSDFDKRQEWLNSIRKGNRKGKKW